ncbi:MAG: MotA/TolQ/ExbB proton channel family protein, partial [Ruminococcus sp.]|nr:MotA/TolQ/ExbB proton channel family protein [Ruminococcus sp.]
MQILEVIKTLLESIFSNDILILIFGILTAAVYMYVRYKNAELKTELEKLPDNLDWALKIKKKLTTWHTVFTTAITIFPLLGMLGTVASLISVGQVDFSATADMSAIKSSFFQALTYTAWGIIFAIGFKIANSFIQSDIDDNLEVLGEIVKKH